ncbi:hypothetical protein HK096_000229, partial [Nowakowskiella sp. JEL0078]
MQAIFLIVGLIRFRHVYFTNTKIRQRVTVFVIPGIIFVIVCGILGAATLAMNIFKLSTARIIAGVSVIYCTIMDVVLSVLFLNALFNGLNMTREAKRQVMFSRDSRRLGLTIILAAVFGVIEILNGVLPVSIATVLSNNSVWAAVLPSFMIIYGLNTFILMSYSTTRTLVQKNSIMMGKILNTSNEATINSSNMNPPNSSVKIPQFSMYFENTSVTNVEVNQPISKTETDSLEFRDIVAGMLGMKEEDLGVLGQRRE